MAKYAHDNVMDAALTYISDNSRKISVCHTQPTTKAQANTTYRLAATALAGGDFSIGNGDSSGRKVTVAQKSNISVVSTGTATHVSMFSPTGNIVVYVTTCATQVLTSGNTVTIPAWDIEIADPT